MTNFLRRALALVVVFTMLAALAMSSPVSAQNGLSASNCWQPGQLSVSGPQMTWTAAPATIIDQNQSYTATLQTTAGTIEIALDALGAPIATNNFICLALAGYYTGTDFHRIFAGTLIQGGDPTATGLGNPGYTLPSDPTLGAYPAGSVSMANALPDRNGSQFFIAATELTGRIPNDYPVFGHVVVGMEVVLAISNGAVSTTASGEQSKPVDPTILLNVTIAEGTVTGGTTVGPVVTVPTATATALPAPTTVAGSGAQDRTTSQPTTIAQAPIAGTSDCTGFDDYSTAFDDMYFNTALQNGDALAFLMSLQNNDSSQSMFEQMTAEQATAMSAFYYALADNLGQLTPPAFAAEWHAVQIEIFRALGDFTANIASQGLTLAAIQASPILTDLTTRSDTALANASSTCADFQAWVSGADDS